MADQTGLPPGNTPGETQYTAEQLAVLQAAMMEELGIMRVDGLHLADRGAAIETLQPLKQPKKKTNAATAGWHTLYLEEGGDPTKADLDNIADGQLYRMRRGASSSAHRGSDSVRGGHFSNGNRGGGGGRGFRGGPGGVHGARGGRGAPGGRGGRQDDRPYVPSRTPGTFFNDARMGMRSSNHLEQVFDRLRGTGSFVSNPMQQQSGRGPRDSPPEKHRQKANTHALPSKPLKQQSRIPQLDNGDRFLQWANFSGSSNTHVPPRSNTIVGKASQSPQPTTHTDNPSFSASVSSTPGIATSGPAVNPPGSQGTQGLMGSRWGPPPQQAVQPETTPALSPQQLSSVPSSSSTPSLPEPAVIRHNNVKVKKDSASTEKVCWAVLKKQNNADEFYTLEVSDASTGEILVDSVVSYDAVFQLDGCVLTYRAAQQITENTPTWKIRFQLPSHASGFAVLVTRDRLNTGYNTNGISNVGHASSSHSVGQQIASLDGPEAIDTSVARTSQTGNFYEQTPETPQAPYHAGFEVLADRADYAQGNATNNSETLITLGDDRNVYTAPPVMSADIFELLEATDAFNLTEGLYAVLGADLEFFNNRTMKGGKPIDDIPLEELVSHPDYTAAIKDDVEEFLLTSEAFCMLPTEYCKALVKHQIPKIMKLALSRRGLLLSPSAAIPATDENIVKAKFIEEKTSLAPSTQDVEPEDDTQTQARASTEDEDSQDFPEHMKDSRIKYSVDTLLTLQDQAVAVTIVEQPPLRSSDPLPKSITPFKAPPPMTSTNGWQVFGASHSKSGTPVLAKATLSVSVASTEGRFSQPETVSDTTSLAASPSKVATGEPSKPAANSWQKFAADEQLKTANGKLELLNPEASSKVTPSHTSVKISLPGISMPDREVKAILKPTITHPSSASVVSSTIVSPPKVRQTNDDGWAARLAIAGALTPVIKSELHIPRGTLRHHPSMSDVNDRLAKSFSDLNLRTKVVVAATEPKALAVDTSLAAPEPDSKVRTSPVPSVVSHNEVSPRSSTSVALTPAGQAMNDKIAAALKTKQSMVASPFQSPASSFSRRSAVGGSMISIKSESSTVTQAKQENAPLSPVTLLKSEPDSNYSRPRGTAMNSTVFAVENPMVSNSLKLSDSQTADMIQFAKAKDAEKFENPEKLEFGGPLPAVIQPAKPSNASEENAKKLLQGSSGLSASRWANALAAPQFSGTRRPNTPQFSFPPTQQEQAPQLSFQPTRHEQAPQPSFQPTHQGGVTRGPQAHHVPTPGYAPMVATVLVPNEDGTYREVTGLYKGGSIPIVPHVPVPQVGHQAYAENVRPSSNNDHVNSPNYPTVSAFPTRPPNNQHQSSFGSISEVKNNPVAPMSSTSPQHPQMSAPQEQRPALSPRRGNIQAQVQSRLNTSMNGTRNAYQGPQS